ncbi:MAG: aldolase/citrate lyase family protein [Actinomycetota bacterium]|nr:aldolase/citrate lyase family protein [Actinomycetota bacterium]
MTKPRPTTRTTRLRERLTYADRLLGTFNLIPSADIVELIAIAGFDLVIIDMEHGPYNLGNVRGVLATADAYGLHTVVRVPTLEPSSISSVLDLGACGVLVPHVESAKDAATVVQAARFAPDGTRGANPWVRAAQYGHRENWFAAANEEVATLVMIEGRAAITELPEIVSVPGLDGVFFGPMDLSHSLGVPGQFDHPSVLEALDGAIRLATAHSLATCLFSPDAQRTKCWWERGVHLVACGVDTGLIRSALVAVVRTARM